MIIVIFVCGTARNRTSAFGFSVRRTKPTILQFRLWERRDSNPQSPKRSDFNANLRPSTSLPYNFLFRYPVYALYTFMKFDLQLSSALFVIYRHTAFTELAGCSSNRFRLELHCHHFFLQSARLPVTGYSPIYRSV